MQIQRNAIYFIRITSDLIILVSVFLSSVILFRNPVITGLSINEYYILFTLIVSWFLFSKSIGLYDEFRSRNFSFEIVSLTKVILSQALTAIVIIFLIKDVYLSRLFVLYYSIILIIILILQKYLFRILFKYLRKGGRNLRTILMVGAGEVGKDFFDSIKNNPHFGYIMVGFLDDENKPFLNGKYLGKISDLDRVLGTREIDNVIISLPNYAMDKIEEVVRVCEKHTTRVKIIPNYFKIVSQKYSASMFGPFPVISVRDDKVNEFNWKLAKRAFDFLFSLFLFVILFSWLWPIIGLIIKLSSPGPVFYKQERWGRNNKRFLVYKFRSMKYSSTVIDENGKYKQAKQNDPRITTIGKFIRKTNIDELPQFWNVLKGEMSIVGPRPHPTPLNEESKDSIKYYMIRHLVKPGITGWAQVNGFRGETSNIEKMQKRIDHDIWYIENWSFWLDIQIVILTIWSMLKGDPNAY